MRGFVRSPQHQTSSRSHSATLVLVDVQFSSLQEAFSVDSYFQSCGCILPWSTSMPLRLPLDFSMQIVSLRSVHTVLRTQRPNILIPTSVHRDPQPFMA
eukprot:6269733-Amphidinium_carterae.1